jgi:methyl-accepting chemotaxis protein
MSVLVNAKIKTKLGLVLLFPLLGALCFSGMLIAGKYRVAREMSALQTVSKLAVSSSQLVHELQKERGMTSLFAGSQGRKFAAELAAQHAETDRAQQALAGSLKSFDRGQFSAAFEEKLGIALRGIEMIDSHRGKVSALTLPAADATAFYTQMIAALLGTIEEIAKRTTEAELSPYISGYTNFLKAKEWTGQERALLSKVFAVDKFEPGILAKLSALIHVHA